MEEILRLFPTPIKEKLTKQMENRWQDLLEIRLRMFKPIELNFTHQVEWLTESIDDADRNYILNQLSEHSLYRYEEELREGYITIEGGHRVGLAGKVTLADNRVKGLKFITSFNIRIAHEKIGVATGIVRYLNENADYLHTLIVGAPQSGKTTVLRDIARLMGNGIENVPAKKVAIIDERSEIAASKNGIPQFDVGMRTDVMDACPKSSGMMMMLRSMSPEVILVDEIGKEIDVQALLDVFHAGVTIVCTAHGSSIEEVKKRRSLKHLFHEDIFKRYVFLSFQQAKGFQYEIYDEHGNRLMKMLEKER